MWLSHAPGTLRRGDGQPRARRSQRGEQGGKLHRAGGSCRHHRAGSPAWWSKGIESWHDDQQGALRGPNRIYILEADGLRIAHLGDLGAWDDALAERLTGLDILLIPVGGYYTIDAQSAAALCHRVQPRMIIPMHYRTQANADWPIAPVEDFLSAMDAQDAPRMPAFARDGPRI